MMWLKFALRNIYKNRRRSAATILAVALGFCSISLFHGYTQETYDGVATSIIHGAGVGHLTIFKQGFSERGRLEPEKYLFNEQEVSEIQNMVTSLPHVVLATPRLNVAGLVSNGKISTIFLAQGVVPEDDAQLRGIFMADDGGLDSDTPSAVQMASDLAAILELAPGDNAVIMGNTLLGMVNALDVDVRNIYNTGVDATNDKFIRMPLTHAQLFYDTQGADKLVVLLNDIQYIPMVKQQLQTLAVRKALDIEIKTWDELSAFYHQLKTMFDMIFLFIFIIVIIVAVMSVINTMSMTVIERIREIGTLRAIGVRRAGIKWLFSVEGGVLGMIGSMVGIIMTLLVHYLIKAMALTFTPPSSTAVVTLNVQLDMGFMLVLSLLLILLALLSAFFPAKRAASSAIVDTLGHV
ncbi:hypothetical protein MNBD_GAMMA25-306 [hydrothermal vent metagenome]|uniref:Uncharacterized protein n=1 Tax=hydrothermal vent metagenome TaxID=652676 RepID=A0A3B1BJ48_9ZZZZ